LHISPRHAGSRTATTQANSPRVHFVSLMSISLEAAASLARRSSIDLSNSAGPCRVAGVSPVAMILKELVHDGAEPHRVHGLVQQDVSLVLGV